MPNSQQTESPKPQQNTAGPLSVGGAGAVVPPHHESSSDDPLVVHHYPPKEEGVAVEVGEDDDLPALDEDEAFLVDHRIPDVVEALTAALARDRPANISAYASVWLRNLRARVADVCGPSTANGVVVNSSTAKATATAGSRHRSPSPTEQQPPARGVGSAFHPPAASPLSPPRVAGSSSKAHGRLLDAINASSASAGGEGEGQGGEEDDAPLLSRPLHEVFEKRTRLAFALEALDLGAISGLALTEAAAADGEPRINAPPSNVEAPATEVTSAPVSDIPQKSPPTAKIVGLAPDENSNSPNDATPKVSALRKMKSAPSVSTADCPSAISPQKGNGGGGGGGIVLGGKGGRVFIEAAADASPATVARLHSPATTTRALTSSLVVRGTAEQQQQQGGTATHHVVATLPRKLLPHPATASAPSGACGGVGASSSAPLSIGSGEFSGGEDRPPYAKKKSTCSSSSMLSVTRGANSNNNDDDGDDADRASGDEGGHRPHRVGGGTDSVTPSRVLLPPILATGASSTSASASVMTRSDPKGQGSTSAQHQNQPKTVVVAGIVASSGSSGGVGTATATEVRSEDSKLFAPFRGLGAEDSSTNGSNAIATNTSTTAKATPLGALVAAEAGSGGGGIYAAMIFTSIEDPMTAPTSPSAAASRSPSTGSRQPIGAAALRGAVSDSVPMGSQSSLIPRRSEGGGADVGGVGIGSGEVALGDHVHTTATTTDSADSHPAEQAASHRAHRPPSSNTNASMAVSRSPLQHSQNAATPHAHPSPASLPAAEQETHHEEGQGTVAEGAMGANAEESSAIVSPIPQAAVTMPLARPAAATTLTAADDAPMASSPSLLNGASAAGAVGSSADNLQKQSQLHDSEASALLTGSAASPSSPSPSDSEAWRGEVKRVVSHSVAATCSSHGGAAPQPIEGGTPSNSNASSPPEEDSGADPAKAHEGEPPRPQHSQQQRAPLVIATAHASMPSAATLADLATNSNLAVSTDVEGEGEGEGEGAHLRGGHASAEGDGASVVPPIAVGDPMCNQCERHGATGARGHPQMSELAAFLPSRTAAAGVATPVAGDGRPPLNAYASPPSSGSTPTALEQAAAMAHHRGSGSILISNPTLSAVGFVSNANTNTTGASIGSFPTNASNPSSALAAAGIRFGLASAAAKAAGGGGGGTSPPGGYGYGSFPSAGGGDCDSDSGPLGAIAASSSDAQSPTIHSSSSNAMAPATAAGDPSTAHTSFASTPSNSRWQQPTPTGHASIGRGLSLVAIVDERDPTHHPAAPHTAHATSHAGDGPAVDVAAAEVVGSVEVAPLAHPSSNVNTNNAHELDTTALTDQTAQPSAAASSSSQGLFPSTSNTASPHFSTSASNLILLRGADSGPTGGGGQGSSGLSSPQSEGDPPPLKSLGAAGSVIKRKTPASLTSPRGDSNSNTADPLSAPAVPSVAAGIVVVASGSDTATPPTTLGSSSLQLTVGGADGIAGVIASVLQTSAPAPFAHAGPLASGGLLPSARSARDRSTSSDPSASASADRSASHYHNLPFASHHMALTAATATFNSSVNPQQSPTTAAGNSGAAIIARGQTITPSEALKTPRLASNSTDINNNNSINNSLALAAAAITAAANGSGGQRAPTEKSDSTEAPVSRSTVSVGGGSTSALHTIAGAGNTLGTLPNMSLYGEYGPTSSSSVAGPITAANLGTHHAALTASLLPTAMALSGALPTNAANGAAATPQHPLYLHHQQQQQQQYGTQSIASNRAWVEGTMEFTGPEGDIMGLLAQLSTPNDRAGVVAALSALVAQKRQATAAQAGGGGRSASSPSFGAVGAAVSADNPLMPRSPGEGALLLTGSGHSSSLASSTASTGTGVSGRALVAVGPIHPDGGQQHHSLSTSTNVTGASSVASPSRLVSFGPNLSSPHYSPAGLLSSDGGNTTSDGGGAVSSGGGADLLVPSGSYSQSIGRRRAPRPVGYRSSDIRSLYAAGSNGRQGSAGQQRRPPRQSNQATGAARSDTSLSDTPKSPTMRASTSLRVGFHGVTNNQRQRPPSTTGSPNTTTSCPQVGIGFGGAQQQQQQERPQLVGVPSQDELSDASPSFHHDSAATTTTNSRAGAAHPTSSSSGHRLLGSNNHSSSSGASGHNHTNGVRGAGANSSGPSTPPRAAYPKSYVTTLSSTDDEGPTGRRQPPANNVTGNPSSAEADPSSRPPNLSAFPAMASGLQVVSHQQSGSRALSTDIGSLRSPTAFSSASAGRGGLGAPMASTSSVNGRGGGGVVVPLLNIQRSSPGDASLGAPPQLSARNGRSSARGPPTDATRLFASNIHTGPDGVGSPSAARGRKRGGAGGGIGGPSRRAGVHEIRNTELAANFVLREYPKTEDEAIVLMACVNKCTLFTAFEDSERRKVVSAMFPAEFPAGSEVLSQGLPGRDTFYLIISGRAEVLKDDKVVVSLGQGEYFGELELMYHSEACAATIKCITPLVTYALEKETYNNIVLNATLARRRIFLDQIKLVDFFKVLSEYDQMRIAEALSIKKFAADEFLIRCGEQVDYMYMLMEGTVTVVGRSKEDPTRRETIVDLGAGQVVGELEFLFQHPAVADVIAKDGRVTVARLSRQHFIMLMGDVFTELKSQVANGNYGHYLDHINEDIRREVDRAERVQRKRRDRDRSYSQFHNGVDDGGYDGGGSDGDDVAELRGFDNDPINGPDGGDDVLTIEPAGEIVLAVRPIITNRRNAVGGNNVSTTTANGNGQHALMSTTSNAFSNSGTLGNLDASASPLLSGLMSPYSLSNHDALLMAGPGAGVTSRVSRAPVFARFPAAVTGGDNLVMIIVQEDGTIIHWNSVIARLTQFKEEDVVGQSIFSFLTNEEQQKQLHERVRSVCKFAGDYEGYTAQLAEEGGVGDGFLTAGGGGGGGATAAAAALLDTARSGGSAAFGTLATQTSANGFASVTSGAFPPGPLSSGAAAAAARRKRLVVEFAQFSGLYRVHLSVDIAPPLVAQPRHRPEMVLISGHEVKRKTASASTDYNKWLLGAMDPLLRGAQHNAARLVSHSERQLEALRKQIAAVAEQMSALGGAGGGLGGSLSAAVVGGSKRSSQSTQSKPATPAAQQAPLLLLGPSAGGKRTSTTPPTSPSNQSSPRLPSPSTAIATAGSPSAFPPSALGPLTALMAGLQASVTQQMAAARAVAETLRNCHKVMDQFRSVSELKGYEENWHAVNIDLMASTFLTQLTPELDSRGNDLIITIDMSVPTSNVFVDAVALPESILYLIRNCNRNVENSTIELIFNAVTTDSVLGAHVQGSGGAAAMAFAAAATAAADGNAGSPAGGHNGYVAPFGSAPTVPSPAATAFHQNAVPMNGLSTTLTSQQNVFGASTGTLTTSNVSAFSSQLHQHTTTAPAAFVLPSSHATSEGSPALVFQQHHSAAGSAFSSLQQNNNHGTGFGAVDSGEARSLHPPAGWRSKATSPVNALSGASVSGGAFAVALGTQTGTARAGNNVSGVGPTIASAHLPYAPQSHIAVPPAVGAAGVGLRTLRTAAGGAHPHVGISIGGGFNRSLSTSGSAALGGNGVPPPPSPPPGPGTVTGSPVGAIRPHNAPNRTSPANVASSPPPPNSGASATSADSQQHRNAMASAGDSISAELLDMHGIGLAPSGAAPRGSPSLVSGAHPNPNTPPQQITAASPSGESPFGSPQISLSNPVAAIATALANTSADQPLLSFDGFGGTLQHSPSIVMGIAGAAGHAMPHLQQQLLANQQQRASLASGGALGGSPSSGVGGGGATAVRTTSSGLQHPSLNNHGGGSPAPHTQRPAGSPYPSPAPHSGAPRNSMSVTGPAAPLHETGIYQSINNAMQFGHGHRRVVVAEEAEGRGGVAVSSSAATSATGGFSPAAARTASFHRRGLSPPPSGGGAAGTSLGSGGSSPAPHLQGLQHPTLMNSRSPLAVDAPLGAAHLHSQSHQQQLSSSGHLYAIDGAGGGVGSSSSASFGGGAAGGAGASPIGGMRVAGRINDRRESSMAAAGAGASGFTRAHGSRSDSFCHSTSSALGGSTSPADRRPTVRTALHVIGAVGAMASASSLGGRPSALIHNVPSTTNNSNGIVAISGAFSSPRQASISQGGGITPPPQQFGSSPAAGDDGQQMLAFGPSADAQSLGNAGHQRNSTSHGGAANTNEMASFGNTPGLFSPLVPMASGHGHNTANNNMNSSNGHHPNNNAAPSSIVSLQLLSGGGAHPSLHPNAAPVPTSGGGAFGRVQSSSVRGGVFAFGAHHANNTSTNNSAAMRSISASHSAFHASPSAAGAQHNTNTSTTFPLHPPQGTSGSPIFGGGTANNSTVFGGGGGAGSPRYNGANSTTGGPGGTTTTAGGATSASGAGSPSDNNDIANRVLQITVRDRGPGISPAVAKKVTNFVNTIRKKGAGGSAGGKGSSHLGSSNGFGPAAESLLPGGGGGMGFGSLNVAERDTIAMSLRVDKAGLGANSMLMGASARFLAGAGGGAAAVAALDSFKGMGLMKVARLVLGMAGIFSVHNIGLQYQRILLQQQQAAAAAGAPGPLGGQFAAGPTKSGSSLLPTPSSRAGPAGGFGGGVGGADNASSSTPNTAASTSLRHQHHNVSASNMLLGASNPSHNTSSAASGTFGLLNGVTNVRSDSQSSQQSQAGGVNHRLAAQAGGSAGIVSSEFASTPPAAAAKEQPHAFPTNTSASPVGGQHPSQQNLGESDVLDIFIGGPSAPVGQSSHRTDTEFGAGGGSAGITSATPTASAASHSYATANALGSGHAPYHSSQTHFGLRTIPSLGGTSTQSGSRAAAVVAAMHSVPPPTGTEFVITIPLAISHEDDDDDDAGARRGRDGAAEGTEKGHRQNFTTILVENSAVHRNMVCQLLWGRKHAVLPASGWRDVARLAEGGTAEILIVDPESFADTNDDDDAQLLGGDLDNNGGIVTSASDHCLGPIERLSRFAGKMAILIMSSDFAGTDMLAAGPPVMQNGIVFLPKPCPAAVLHQAIMQAETLMRTRREEERRIAKSREAFTKTNHAAITKIRLLGRGAFGEVHEVEDTITKGRMAMKILTSKSEEDTNEVLKEIQAMTVLKHENIIHYIYCEKVDDRNLKIFMELASGGTIADKIKATAGKGIPLETLRPFVRDILRGLDYIHKLRWVHCDIKPQNVLLDREGRCKLGDFGTATHLEPDNVVGVTAHKGTPSYMAPEVVEADAVLQQGFDMKADIWSLGVTVMEMATGQPPFSHIPEARGHLVMKYTSDLKEKGETPDLSPLFSCDPLIFEFVQACLNPNAAERPTAGELLSYGMVSEGGAVGGGPDSGGDAGRILRKAQLLHILNQFVAFKTEISDREKRELARRGIVGAAKPLAADASGQAHASPSSKRAKDSTHAKAAKSTTAEGEDREKDNKSQSHSGSASSQASAGVESPTMGRRFSDDAPPGGVNEWGTSSDEDDDGTSSDAEGAAPKKTLLRVAKVDSGHRATNASSSASDSNSNSNSGGSSEERDRSASQQVGDDVLKQLVTRTGTDGFFDSSDEDEGDDDGEGANASAAVAGAGQRGSGSSGAAAKRSLSVGESAPLAPTSSAAPSIGQQRLSLGGAVGTGTIDMATTPRIKVSDVCDGTPSTAGTASTAVGFSAGAGSRTPNAGTAHLSPSASPSAAGGPLAPASLLPSSSSPAPGTAVPTATASTGGGSVATNTIAIGHHSTSLSHRSHTSGDDDGLPLPGRSVHGGGAASPMSSVASASGRPPQSPTHHNQYNSGLSLNSAIVGNASDSSAGTGLLTIDSGASPASGSGGATSDSANQRQSQKGLSASNPDESVLADILNPSSGPSALGGRPAPTVVSTVAGRIRPNSTSLKAGSGSLHPHSKGSGATRRASSRSNNNNNSVSNNDLDYADVFHRTVSNMRSGDFSTQKRSALSVMASPQSGALQSALSIRRVSGGSQGSDDSEGDL